MYFKVLLKLFFGVSVLYFYFTTFLSWNAPKENYVLFTPYIFPTPKSTCYTYEEKGGDLVSCTTESLQLKCVFCI
jgi:hypothetical protein